MGGVSATRGEWGSSKIKWISFGQRNGTKQCKLIWTVTDVENKVGGDALYFMLKNGELPLSFEF